jgi:hypothetical protein
VPALYENGAEAAAPFIVKLSTIAQEAIVATPPESVGVVSPIIVEAPEFTLKV